MKRLSRRLLSLLLTFALTASLLLSCGSLVAGAAGALTPDELWALMGDTVYTSEQRTATAVEKNGTHFLRLWQPPESMSIDVNGDDVTLEPIAGGCRMTVDNSALRTLLKKDDYKDYTITFLLSDGKITSITVEDADYFEYIEESDTFIDFDYNGEYTIADGSDEHPWFVGKDALSPLFATVSESEGLYSLYFSGSGEMQDFESLSDRPWDSIADDICFVAVWSMDEPILSIGKNAFAYLGGNLPGDIDFYLSLDTEGGLETIGESACEGLKLGDVQSIPGSITSIGSRAFADVDVDILEWQGGVPEIADDAFEGVTAEAQVIDSFWPEEDRKDYGGKLTYRSMCMIQCMIVDGDDQEESSYLQIAVPTGEPFDWDLVDEVNVKYSYDPETGAETEIPYYFSRYEVIYGSLELEDPTDRFFSITPTDNVALIAIYDRHLYHNLKKIEGKKPTTPGESGWEDYCYCEDCDEYLEDSDWHFPIEDLEYWKQNGGKLYAYIVSGDNGASWKPGDGDLTFRIDGDFYHAVYLDGVELDPKLYYNEEDESLVRLPASFLETLLAGEHRLLIEVYNGDGEASFTILPVNPEEEPEEEPGEPKEPQESDDPSGEKSNPSTGDPSEPLWAVLLSGMALCGLFAFGRTRKRTH